MMNAAELIYILSLAFGIGSIFVLFFRIRPQNKRLIFYLSGFLLILGTSNLMVVLLGTGIMLKVPWLYKLLMPFSFLAPVLGYWYVNGTLHNLDKLRLFDYIHLVLFALVIVHYLPFYFLPIEEKRQVVASVIDNNANAVNDSNGWIFSELQILIIRAIQTAFYVMLSWRIIQTFIVEHSELEDRRTKTVINWLKFFVRMKGAYLTAVVLCYLLLGLQFKNVFFNEFIAQVLFLLTAALVFVLSSYLLLHPKALLSIEKPIRAGVLNDSLSLDQLIDRIRFERWYSETELTQPVLLKRLDIKAIDFSLLLKNAGYENFNAFVNTLRLEAFISRASTDEVQRNSIEGIAQACGFRSSSTFYRVFKEKYNCTPRQFLEKHQR